MRDEILEKLLDGRDDEINKGYQILKNQVIEHLDDETKEHIATKVERIQRKSILSVASEIGNGSDEDNFDSA